MKCPIDETQLVMSERSGIEIDYCPRCRGVWLDRGELDKIIDRSVGTSAPATSQALPQQQQPQPVFGRGGGHHGNSTDHYGQRRKKSWLSELFD